MRLLRVEHILDYEQRLTTSSQSSAQQKGKIFEDSEPSAVSYAVLSHRWGEEILYGDICDKPWPELNTEPYKESWRKIEGFCRVARASGLDFVWIDSCCINKPDRDELSMSLTSMYEWYRRATLCVTYLGETQAGQDLTEDVWFQRGWTLQELLAPPKMEFYDKNWAPLGQRSDPTIEARISERTGIPPEYLQTFHANREKACIAQKFSWAAKRTTARAEDRVYSLFGIFNVVMDIRYGVGLEAELRRFQELIIERSDDESIFAWKSDSLQESGMIAQTIDDFATASGTFVDPARHHSRGSYRLTNRGLELPVPMWVSSPNVVDKMLSRLYRVGKPVNIPLNCWDTRDGRQQQIRIVLKKVGGRWRRIQCGELWYSDRGKVHSAVVNLFDVTPRTGNCIYVS